MKKIITAAAALLLSVATFAQSNDSPPPASGQQMGQQHRAPMSPEQRAKRETDQMNTMVPLGDAFAKVLEVNTQIAQKRESIMGGAKRSEMTDDQRAQLKQLRGTQDQQLKAAMGPDLYAKWKAAEKAKRESGGGQHNGN